MNRPAELSDQQMSSLIVFKNARSESMSDHFSLRDLSTYKQWLAKIAIVHCAVAVAIILGISWDVAYRRGIPAETAQSFENPTAKIQAVSNKQ
jgi:hypothetical protein